MKIDVLGVQAFVALAEHHNFRVASASLFISQAALSRRLQNLEAHLGVTLVERSSRHMALTHVGQGFLPQARRLLSELQASLAQIRETGQLRGGDVTLACVPTVGVQYLPRVIEAYARAYPDNRVAVLDHASAGVAQAVLSREAEFGIGIAGPQPPELASELLLHDRFVLVCPRDHAYARAAPRDLVAAGAAEAHPAGRRQQQPTAARRPAARSKRRCVRTTRCSAVPPRWAWWRPASVSPWCRVLPSRPAPTRCWPWCRWCSPWCSVASCCCGARAACCHQPPTHWPDW